MGECLERMACKACMMRGQMILKLRLVFTWLNYAGNANTHTHTHTERGLFTFTQNDAGVQGRRGGAAGSFCAAAASRFITLNSRPERPQIVCNMSV